MEVSSTRLLAMTTPVPFPFRSPWPLGLSAVALALSLGGGAVLAQPVGPGPRVQRLTPEQREKVFPEQRQLMLRDRQARIAVLQKGERCLSNAARRQSRMASVRAEREAMWQQRREYMAELQALYERNGLPTPQWKRLEKPRGPRPNAGVSDI
jgi:hypothetical protein